MAAQGTGSGEQTTFAGDQRLIDEVFRAETAISALKTIVRLIPEQDERKLLQVIKRIAMEAVRNEP